MLINSTSYLFYWVAGSLVARDLATIFWLRVAMPKTNRAALEGRLKHLSPMQHPKCADMLVVVGRASAGLKHHFQRI